MVTSAHVVSFFPESTQPIMFFLSAVRILGLTVSILGLTFAIVSKQHISSSDVFVLIYLD